MSKLQEYLDVQAYDASNFTNPKEAVNEFLALNTMVKRNKEVDRSQIKNFLQNVYKGGSDGHFVTMKDFTSILLKKGIAIFNRNNKYESLNLTTILGSR